MRFMVIEHFKNRDPAPIYARFCERGRMMPDGLSYVDSWIEATFDRCFQVMETDDPELFRAWTSQWDDLMDFEIIPVLSSAEMRERFA